MPRVSVIVANYNNERYLSECLDSLLQQSYRDFEVLVFDDASTDNSRELIGKYADMDKRFKLIALPVNKGVAHLRSISLSYCAGEYVAVLDADDYSDKDRLKREVVFLDSHPQVVLVGGMYATINETSKVLSLSKPLPENDLELRWSMSTSYCFVHSTVMLRKDAALAAGGYNANMTCAEDMDLFSRLMLHGKMATIPHLLSYWRTHSISYTGQASDKILSGTYENLAGTAKRVLGKDITQLEAKALYHLKAHSRDALVIVLDVIQSYRKLYSQNTSVSSEQHLLLRLHLKMLLDIKKRNQDNSWYREVQPMLENHIKEIVSAIGYYWLWDRGLNLSTRNWLFLISLSLKPQGKD